MPRHILFPENVEKFVTVAPYTVLTSSGWRTEVLLPVFWPKRNVEPPQKLLAHGNPQRPAEHEGLRKLRREMEMLTSREEELKAVIEEYVNGRKGGDQNTLEFGESPAREACVEGLLLGENLGASEGRREPTAESPKARGQREAFRRNHHNLLAVNSKGNPVSSGKWLSQESSPRAQKRQAPTEMYTRLSLKTNKRLIQQVSTGISSKSRQKAMRVCHASTPAPSPQDPRFRQGGYTPHPTGSPHPGVTPRGGPHAGVTPAVAPPSGAPHPMWRYPAYRHAGGPPWMYPHQPPYAQGYHLHRTPPYSMHGPLVQAPMAQKCQGVPFQDTHQNHRPATNKEREQASMAQQCHVSTSQAKPLLIHGPAASNDREDVSMAHQFQGAKCQGKPPVIHCRPVNTNDFFADLRPCRGGVPVYVVGDELHLHPDEVLIRRCAEFFAVFPHNRVGVCCRFCYAAGKEFPNSWGDLFYSIKDTALHVQNSCKHSPAKLKEYLRSRKLEASGHDEHWKRTAEARGIVQSPEFEGLFFQGQP